MSWPSIIASGIALGCGFLLGFGAMGLAAWSRVDGLRTLLHEAGVALDDALRCRSGWRDRSAQALDAIRRELSR